MKPTDADSWSDERLAEAFTARAAATPATPVGLEADVLRRASKVAPRSPVWPRFAALASGVALIAVVVGLSIRPTPLQPSGSQAPGSANATASEPSGPRSAVLDALGSPITVSAALAVRNESPGDREIVVAGFLSPLPALPCALMTGPFNPTLLRCPHTFQWVMGSPEPLETTTPGSLELHPPTVPAFQPAFVSVDAPDVPGPDGFSPAVAVELVGHFHDRRAALCPEASREACGQTFVVDRVARVDGHAVEVETQLGTDRAPSDLQEDVDRLVAGAAPGAVIESRQLVTVEQALTNEPVLANDPVVPHLSDQSSLAWIVTTVDLRDGAPVARTFMLLDGSNWFAEITADGATMLDRHAAGPSPNPSSAIPSADPAALQKAPEMVLGLPVQGVAEVTQDRRLGSQGRGEYAIAAWYLAPRPDVVCGWSSGTIHPPVPPCDEARAWLLDDPRQYGVEIGQLRASPEQWPRVLNPLLPVDVSLAVSPTWRDGSPEPQPVVVLGHFDDMRVVEVYAGNVYFVIDALAWTEARGSLPLDRVTRLTSAATEDPAAVVARVESITPNEAFATWATAVDAEEFAHLEPDAAQTAVEFTSGAPVWVVRRLIADQSDGASRLAVETGYTADHGTRVWWTPTPDSEADLATSIDVANVDANTNLVRVYDYGNQIAGARAADGFAGLAWHELGPVGNLLEVARGRTNRELVVRWRGRACATTWRFDVSAGDRDIVLQPKFSDDCVGDEVKRSLVIDFVRPVDLDWFRTTDPCCG